MSDQENSHNKNLDPGHLPVPVVAIGGSAGGQKAVIELLKHLPADTGLAYVYIQHLAPDRESKLDEILARVTSMTVMQASPLLPVKPNHLYIIPPNKSMEIVDGVLVLTQRKPRPDIHLPIDQFFISLAERQKDGAIGIVLSGMSSDGTMGLKAIKVAGGITLVQDDSAEYPAMPQSAISENVVDMVLSPKEMAAELVKLSQRAAVFHLTSETRDIAQNDFSDEDLDKILGFVKTAVGVDFRHYKKNTIRRRIIRRMLLYKLDTLADYTYYLKKHPEEATTLYKDLLINVTSFFRDEKTMEHLKKQVLPSIIRSKAANEPIRFWVAGCSTGQEAYSLAILLIEVLGDRASSVPVQIFATDLSEPAIARARLGIYTKSEVKEVSAQRLERFFTATEDQFRVNKPIRDLCVFAPHDLLSDPPFSRLDMISCRNLLIYLDDSLQKRALATFHYALNPDGILLLGKSEAVGSSPSHFSQIEKEFKVFVRKNTTYARIPMDVSIKRSNPIFGAKATQSKEQNVLQTTDIDKLVDSWLLNNHFPACVVVDQDLEILHFRGATGMFLEPSPGKASLNLTKMARAPLVFELRNTIHKARKSDAPVTKNGLELPVNGTMHYVSIKAVPLIKSEKQQLFLILFEEIEESQWLKAGTVADVDRRNLLLEAELTALKQDLHSIIEEQEASNEELQSANEEIISSNEELQSINEELETSKEEIESANEELQTINQELQVRNDQLTESYEYSEAILSTINEATLVLDNQLRVKNANRAFYRIFQSPFQDVEGSSVYELADRQLDFTGFREIMHEVLSRGNSIKGFEVKLRLAAQEEHFMLVHARKILLHRKETVLLVFEDITEHRRAQDLFRERQQWFEELVDNANAFIWVSSADGTVNFLNKAWLDFTGQSFDRGKGHKITENIHTDDREPYDRIKSDNVSEKKSYQAEYRLRRRDGEYRWVLESAKPMFSPDGAFTGYIGTCTDIHLQKTLTEQLNKNVEERTRQLKQVNANLQAVLDSSPASIGFFKPVPASHNAPQDYMLAVCNQKFSDAFGIQVDQITGQLMSGLYQKPNQQWILAAALEKRSQYKEIFDEASQSWLGVSVSHHPDGVAVTELDTTALKEALHQQKSLVEQLKESFQMIESLSVLKEYIRHRGTFLRSAFHDLRGSFGIISGAATLLQVMDTEEDRAQSLAMIQRNLQNITSMMNQLLDYSRLEAGEEKLEIDQFDVSVLLSELCQGSAKIAADKKLGFHFDGPRQIIVQGDMVKVRRIAQNLILNAIKYTGAGEVKVTWGPVEASVGGRDMWKLTVQDTGPGIPDMLVENLFTDSNAMPADAEAPGRPAGAVHTSQKGEGIGLFIVKRLVELLEGTIEVKTGNGGGTRFEVWLPASY
ncbi:CheR family methyltransferase [Dyadobacter sp. 676]|uniref:CheR family methyltransferase n=1 Tax=Dyadobacter sp. 676 TaxID=3088362 RepID=A0AAU8FI69_9BACT